MINTRMMKHNQKLIQLYIIKLILYKKSKVLWMDQDQLDHFYRKNSKWQF